MKDAWTSNDLNIIRSRPAGAKWYLAVKQQASIASATLQSVPSYPAASIALQNTTQSWSQVASGMTIVVQDINPAGPTGPKVYGEKGRIRLRRPIDASNSSVIYIAEAGCGLINWKVGDRVVAVNQRAPWVKHPRYDADSSAWKMDYDEEYTDQLESYGPVVRAGPGFVGILNGAAEIYGSFVGASTKFWDDATSSTASWSFQQAEITNGQSVLGTPDDPVTVKWTDEVSAGRYFHLRATDNNGASHQGRRPFFIFNNTSQTPRVEFAQITGGLEKGGYEAQFRVLSNAGSDLFPDMAEFLIFEEASFGGTASNIGGNYPYAANIVMRGWIIGESVRVNPFSGDVTFRARTVDGILEHQESYDTFLTLSSTDVTRAAFPSALSPADSINTDWNAAASLSLDRMFYHLVKHRSNLADFVDVNFAGGDFGDASKLILFQDLPRAPFWKQLQMNYFQKGFLGYVAADMQSNVFAGEDIQISGGSDNVPIALPMNKADRRDMVQIERSVIDPVAEAHLLSVSGSDPYWAISPGQVMGYFGGKKEHSKGLFWHQDDLVQRVGNYRAKLNNEYPKLVIPLAGNYRLDSVPQSRVTMSLSPADNPRGLKWDDEGFIPTKTTLTYNAQAGAVLADIEMEKIVQGIGGSAVTFPADPQSVEVDNSGIPDPDPGDDPCNNPYALCSGINNIVAVNTDGYQYVTNNFQNSSPTWSRDNLGLSGSIHSFVVDPFSPLYIGTGSTVDYWVVTSTNIYYIQDAFGISGGPTVNDQHTFATAIPSDGRRRINASFGNYNSNQAWVMVVTHYRDATGHTGTWAIYSQDGGSTWSSEVQISGHYNNGAGDIFDTPGLNLSPKTGGLGYSFAHTTTADPPVSDGYLTQDWGGSWARISNPDLQAGDYLGGVVHVPWPDNLSEGIAYHGWLDREPTRIFRTYRVNGTTRTDASPSDGTRTYAPASNEFGIKTFDSDRRYVVMVGTGNSTSADSGDDYRAAYISEDGGDSWTEIFAPVNSANNVPRGVAFSGNTKNVIYLWGNDGYISYSQDFGSTIDDRSGNISSLGTPGNFIGIAGG
jgi:hypothetical protein